MTYHFKRGCIIVAFVYVLYKGMRAIKMYMYEGKSYIGYRTQMAECVNTYISFKKYLALSTPTLYLNLASDLHSKT